MTDTKPPLSAFNMFVEAAVAIGFLILWAVTLRNAVTADVGMVAVFWTVLMAASAGAFGVMVRQLVGRL